MFKAFDPSRPWADTGMTTEKWKQVPIFTLGIDDLIATQDGVKLSPLITPGESFCGDEIPHVVSWRGNLYLEDGHHRVIGALCRNEKKIRARVLTVIDHGE